MINYKSTGVFPIGGIEIKKDIKFTKSFLI